MFDLTQVVFNHFTTIPISWRSDVDLAVEATGAQQCRVKGVRNVGCTNSQNRLVLHAAMCQAKYAENLLKPACLDVRRVHLHQQLVKATGAPHSTEDTAAHRHRS